MKKNITLISLMLGIMLMISVTGMVSAHSYLDIKEVKLNGANQVTVAPSASITASVKTDAHNEWWKSTKYQIEGGSWICVNTGNHYNSVETESFGITAPSSVGTYNFGVKIYENEACDDFGDSKTLYNGIIVVQSVCGNGQTESGEECDAGQLNGQVCTPSYGSSCNYCSLQCKTVTVQGPYCGDGIKNGDEQCDDGNLINGDGCSSTCEKEPCKLTITNPLKGQWFDSEPVPINWNLSSWCTPVNYFDIQYQTGGTCNEQGPWTNIINKLDSQTAQNPAFPNYKYTWDQPSASGQYCLTVKVSSAGAYGYSGVFNVDLAPPVVSLDVGENHVGECGVDETGDCYVNQDTEITISCADNTPEAPWQSGVDYMEYRYYVNGELYQDWTETPGTFTFPEDSNHLLEYRCYDKVGKKDEGSKTFIVDSVGPEFVEKTIGEPQYCEEEECEMYVTQDTEICVSYEDPIPHPVGGVVIYCSATVKENPEDEGYNVDIVLDKDGCFTFSEDSHHSLYCWAEDALGNTNEKEDLYEQDIVDTEAPETTLSFNEPYYTDQTSQWIDTVSTISLTAEDPQPHPVGLDKTYYRYEKISDEYCYHPELVQWEPTPLSDESWMEYNDESFGLPESCHVIEYYSVDKLGNKESVNVEFVFSDHTAPEAIKEVGKPSHECTALDRTIGTCEDDWDWKVTLNTPVYLSCVDQGNHPAGASQLCYKITWDGGDITYGGELTEDGYYCVDVQDGEEIELYFEGECEHILDFYCVDHVGKTSDNDVELFKVEGEPFEIPLDKKWNLISVPVNLLSSNIEDVFGDNENIEIIWSYENGEWKSYTSEIGGDLDEILPGHGYWVKASDSTSIVIGGSLFSPAVTPSSVELDKGWNLIGHYGIPSKSAYCSLFSLIDTQQGFPRWSSLWGYESGTNAHFVPLNSWSTMNAGEGYWIEMDVEDSYSPSSICWGYQQLS